MSRPIIYFGPPKAATSFIYRAMCASKCYQQMAVKEWRYLRPLYLHGSLGYIERMGVYYGTQEYYSTWSPIYYSHVEHLRFLQDKPSNCLVLTQLAHAQALIFKKHDLKSYFELFDLGGDFYRVDLDPLNHTVSVEFLAELVATRVDAIFLSGVRPFIPHLTSLICETYAWFDSSNHGSLDVPVDVKSLDDKIILKFESYIVDVLENLRSLYKEYTGEQVECMDFTLGKLSVAQNGAQMSSSDSVIASAALLYLHTNIAMRIKKVSKASIPQSSILYYYSPNISQALPEIFSWLQSKGVMLGDINIDISSDRVRESDKSVISAIFNSPRVRDLVLSISKLSAEQHKEKLPEPMYQIVFPDVSDEIRDWGEFCREIDKRTAKTIF